MRELFLLTGNRAVAGARLLITASPRAKIRRKKGALLRHKLHGSACAAELACWPRMAEHNIATHAIMPLMKKLKFIDLTNTVAFAAVGVAVASPL